MTNMRNLGWNILVLSFAFLASAKVAKKCSAPPEYPQTRLMKKLSGGQMFSSGQKVYYDCGEDFTPTRGSRAVQCVGGQWTKLTLKCEKKSCGNAGELPNGEFHYEGNAFVGEKVYAVCNEGYTLKGLNYMICKKSGWTGDFPSCEKGEATCSPPAVSNSVSSAGDVSAHRVGDSLTFTCSQGFQLDGAQQITCGPGGLWQPQPPQCLPSPDPTPSPVPTPSPDQGRESVFPTDGGCSVPGTVHNSNAHLADKYFKMTSFASGDRVHYVCDVGYVYAGGSRYRKCVEGKWTPALLKCEGRLCGSAGEIMYGEFTYTGVQFGDIATAVCDEGHRLVGKATRNCRSQGWDGRVPTCEAVACEEPTGVTNAEARGLHEPPYTHRSVISYRCHVGTLIGERHIWCTENGTWSHHQPTCREITCPSPNVANAYWMRGQVAMFHERDTISIECYRGYTMTGQSSITCNRDGRWYPGLPKCTRRQMTRTNWRG